MSILEAFYYGNFIPEEHLKPIDSALADQLSRMEKEIENLLSEDNQRLFRGYVDQAVNVNALDIKDNFIYGFRMGMLLMMETFIKSKDLPIHNEARV